MEDLFFRPGTPGVIPDSWVINAGAPNSGPPIVAVHGIQRQVEKMAALLLPRASAIGRTVVLPHFSTGHWKRYQRAACPNRSDKALLSLMREMVEDSLVSAGPFDLAGFSGGAQFAHRFTWMHPNAVGRLCVTAPGWWTFPEAQFAWPYGMGHSNVHQGIVDFRLQTNLKRFLNREIAVSVGSDDIKRDRNLRKGPDIDAQQGVNRMARAENWVSAMRGVAHSLGVQSDISFTLLKGVGHSFSNCVKHARLDHLFIQPFNACGPCQFRHACNKSNPLDIPERNAA